MSSIEWTDETWNPTVGCSIVSDGCAHCYAMRVAHRGMTPSHKGLTRQTSKGPRWTGEVRTLPERLAEPLRWRKPRRVFVDSMSDLFHEAVPDEYIAAVFGVMAATPQHTYQVLTKRPERAREWFRTCNHLDLCQEACAVLDSIGFQRGCGSAFDPDEWPLPNIWLGTSVEDQATADARIPHLLQCPAEVRFVSYEPALGPVDFAPYIYAPFYCYGCGNGRDFYYDTNPDSLPVIHRCTLGTEVTGEPGAVRCRRCESRDVYMQDCLDWIIVGGESGPGARPFDVQWARDTIAQCREAGTACFVKQLGSRASDPVNGLAGRSLEVPQEGVGLVSCRLRDRKGGDPEEWPEDLRIRQWPEAPHA